MRTFLVAYDLTRRNDHRPAIADAIMRSAEHWARPLDNVWYLRTAASSADIERQLAGLIGEDDGLLVQEARGEAVLSNTSLRWFRRRRDSSNVVPFPVEAANDDGTGAVREAG